MTKTMKKAYRMFKRKNRPNFYIQNNSTREQRCLGTSDRAEAQKLLDVENLTRQSPALNMLLAKAYITHSDPKMATRTWQEAIDEMSSHGKAVSKARYAREFKSTVYEIIRNKPIIETTSEDLKAVLKRGGVQTNNYLHRLHNLALGNGWIQWSILPPKQWPKSASQPKRAITIEEHQKIIAAEQGNEERQNYYKMLWLIGAAQTDCAILTAENINWDTHIISYSRCKTGENASLQIGVSLEALLKKLPKQGFLFPRISKLSNKDRSAEFYRRCKILKIKGISLHSYRYSWAERAYSSGYEERFSQAALGHKSRAVHHAYAKRAIVVCPPLENATTTLIESNPQVLVEGGTIELIA